MAAPHQPAHGLPLGPQPNIPVLEQSFHNAGVELGRLANIPALAQGDAIINRLDQMQNQMGQHGQLLQQQGQQLQQQGQQLQQIVQMQQRMFQAQQQMQRQMDQNFANVRTTQRASEFNSIARLQNSAAKHQGSTLTALHDTFTNLVVPGFPQTCAALAALDEAQIDAILTALGLDPLGTLADRRSLLKFFIGVPDT